MSFALQRNTITLQGSAQIVAEYFQYAVNNILYQRGVYPQETFDVAKKYGCNLWLNNDEGLTKYLHAVLQQTKVWLEQGKLKQLVLVITEADTKEVLERWTFDINTNRDVLEGKGPLPDKPEKEITQEIQAIMRQISASVSFLPLLESRCLIDILVYTDSMDAVPEEWEDSDPRSIDNAEMVALRGFSTKVHAVKTMVTYKQQDDVL
ncbi:mitotic spindle assembly checkpoint protein [Dunaliella salina]|uniref:Mitotic spindle assembly checkpoint protein n=1 Tax=Dunaliella salina TaxID=3046 RepID=A0ABQ7H0K9_DUNSA|nr:mitotic spindle assembly checkpoint protein [Dunaliella salina]|eukprot:KAF5840364.1 mitotic spindle assembly checkpoint protein [Dunaliella salina]